jgi:hypothetical protein
MKSKSTKKNSSQTNYQKYFNYWTGKGKPEKLKNAVLQHPEDTDDSIYGYMQKNKSRNAWVMNFDQYKKLGESNLHATSESANYKNNQSGMKNYLQGFKNFKLNESNDEEYDSSNDDMLDLDREGDGVVTLDSIAMKEFGTAYDKLGPNEREWCRDEYDSL